MDGSENPNLEAVTLNLDSSLARALLNWAPAWSQEEAVIATIKLVGNVVERSVSPQDACKLGLEFLLRHKDKNIF